jgi:acetate kinase
VRQLTLERLALLGVVIDRSLNAEHGASAAGRISVPESRVPAFVVPTNEELIIARETLQCVGAPATSRQPPVAAEAERVRSGA